jgi:hypothetical protein
MAPRSYAEVQSGFGYPTSVSGRIVETGNCLYQAQWRFSTTTLTTVFGVYARAASYSAKAPRPRRRPARKHKAVTRKDNDNERLGQASDSSVARAPRRCSEASAEV